MTEPAHRVLKLWIRPRPAGEILEQETLTLETDRGVVGDYCLGKRRHVTIVFLDDWKLAAAEIGRLVDPAGRRANVLVSGCNGPRFKGETIRLGECVLEIKGITHPCARMEDAAEGMKEALEPDGRAGVWGLVRSGGTLRLGDTLEPG